ncbi:probable cytosolic oligopeptidase A isoform X2 [Ornithorhynchus anatinus]|nr:probable cytosolic oligopeptidase A isoform X2 [Ornithorhynchus anatinus]
MRLRGLGPFSRPCWRGLCARRRVARLRPSCPLWGLLAAALFLVWKWMFLSFGRGGRLLDELPALGPEPNPLLDVSGLPRFSAIRPAHVVPGILQAAKELQKALEDYEAHLLGTENGSGTWESVEEPLEKLQFPISYSWQIVNHLLMVKNSPELREAHQQVQPLMMNLTSQIAQSLPIYNSFKELSRLPGLVQAQRRILAGFLRAARQRGAELARPQRERFNAVSLRLANLSTAFVHRVLDATKAFSLLLRDRDSVEGLPAFARMLLATNAVAGTDQSPDPDAGPWRATLDAPSYEAVMKHSPNRELRQQLYRARVTRAPGNRGLVDEIRALRQEAAGILGYQSYADLSLVSKMAGRKEAVWTFLNYLHNKSYHVAKAEQESLQKFAQRQGHLAELEHWDVAFWAERQREALFRLKDEEVRPYFPLERVLSGLFKLCTDIFGVTIHPADGAAEVWASSVRFFYVYDEKGTPIASFYLDPYSRPQEKKEGAWMLNFISRSRLLHHTPVAFVVCNQIPPVGSAPSLMSFTEVITLFHEFGHALQHMLSTVPYAEASGINNIEWDVVEAASQFLENWPYDWNTLVTLSGHYQTGERLPASLFREIRRARHYLSGSTLLFQLYLAALDMELHSSTDPWPAVKSRVAEKFTVRKPLPEDCILCTFTHIFGDDSYAAGYYSYMWAELLAQDEFEAFAEVGLQNRERLAKVGRRYRDTVLSLGGSISPQEVFRKFRGRDPSPDALLRTYGLLEAPDRYP